MRVDYTEWSLLYTKVQGNACENNLNCGIFSDSYLCGSTLQLLDAKVLQISSVYMLMLSSVFSSGQSSVSYQAPGKLNVLPATKTTLETKLKGGAVERAKLLSGFQRLKYTYWSTKMKPLNTNAIVPAQSENH